MIRRLAIAAALIVFASACDRGTNERESGDRADSPFAGIELPDPTPSPDFALEDERGRSLRLSDQRGKVVFVTFLYTRCPDVCPLIAEALNRALKALGSDRAAVRVLAVSVDPEGDTPGRVRLFAADHRLRPEFHYLLGSEKELEPVWRLYDVFALAAEPGSEMVEHSAQTVLVDREGLRRVVYPSDATTDDYVKDARILLGQ